MVSRWQSLPHKLWVQKRRPGKDSRGSRDLIPYDDPIFFRGDFQTARDWSSAEETFNQGWTVLERGRIFCKKFPGDEYSLVYFNGYTWDCTGAPQLFDASPRTTHWAVTVKRIAQHVPDNLPEP